MSWRIYRLPGSRLVWHVDTGPGTQIVNVRGFQTFVPSYSVDDESKHPRAWIEVPFSWNYDSEKPGADKIERKTEFHVIDGIAVWTVKPAMQIVREITLPKEETECAAVAADQSA